MIYNLRDMTLIAICSNSIQEDDLSEKTDFN